MIETTFEKRPVKCPVRSIRRMPADTVEVRFEDGCDMIFELYWGDGLLAKGMNKVSLWFNDLLVMAIHCKNREQEFRVLPSSVILAPDNIQSFLDYWQSAIDYVFNCYHKVDEPKEVERPNEEYRWFEAMLLNGRGDMEKLREMIKR